MKILYHHRIASLEGGETVHIRELVSALRNLGHDVIVVGHVDIDGKARLRPVVTTSVRRWLPKVLGEPLELAYSLRAYLRLRRAYLIHKPDVLYERANLFLLAGLWLKRRYGLPYLLEVNAPHFDERLRLDGIVFARLARWSEETAWQGANYVLPVSNVLAGYVRRAGVPSERVVVIPNAVNLALFGAPIDDTETRRNLGIEGKTTLGFAGHLRDWHRLERVINLLERATGKNLHLLIIGEGAGLPRLRRETLARGLSQQVTFLGATPRDAVAGLMSAVDIALQPGVTPYASPLKIFEYMALGRPIVAPDTPNIREILRHGETALLFDPESERSFEEAVLRLALDSALRTSLGAAARAEVIDKSLTWEKNASKLVTLAERLIAPKAPGSQQR